MIKAKFAASLHQSSVSHDPSEILLMYADLLLNAYFLLLSMLKTVVQLNIFVESKVFTIYVITLLMPLLSLFIS